MWPYQSGERVSDVSWTQRLPVRQQSPSAQKAKGSACTNTTSAQHTTRVSTTADRLKGRKGKIQGVTASTKSTRITTKTGTREINSRKGARRTDRRRKMKEGDVHLQVHCCEAQKTSTAETSFKRHVQTCVTEGTQSVQSHVIPAAVSALCIFLSCVSTFHHQHDFRSNAREDHSLRAKKSEVQTRRHEPNILLHRAPRKVNMSPNGEDGEHRHKTKEVQHGGSTRPSLRKE